MKNTKGLKATELVRRVMIPKLYCHPLSLLEHGTRRNSQRAALDIFSIFCEKLMGSTSFAILLTQ